MKEESLKNKTVKGVGWSAIDNLVQHMVTFVVSIVLARLLAREYFEHKNAGDYEMSKILRRMTQSRRQKNN